ncbi:MAG: peptidylprolyl isomerase [Gammaproteobacteria bacterium]
MKKEKFSSLISRLTILLAVCANASGATTELDRIVAVVEEDVIMESELADQMDRVRAALRQQGTQMPPTAVLERQVMERLVLEKIQLQIADRAGIEVEERALDQAVADIASRNNLSLDQFREIIVSEGYKFDTFREQIRQEILIAKLRREEVDNRVRVRDSEIENYLHNEMRGEDNQEYRLSHILVATPSGADNEEIRAARTKAEETLARIEAGEDFATVAISVSDGQQALEGGDLGWRKGGEIPSLFADSVSTMEPGDHSGIITSTSGFHIVKLTDKRSGEKIMVPQWRVRHILIKPNELLPPDQALNRLRQIRMRIENGANFGVLARTNSDDRGSALQGGDLGWVSKGQMVPKFEEVMLAMEPGEMSAPFETEFGFHILEVTDTREYDGTDEIRRNQARQALRQKKIDERRQSWLRRLRDEAYVEYRDILE